MRSPRSDHRSDAVEYRIEQHAEALTERLAKLAFVTTFVTGGSHGAGQERRARCLPALISRLMTFGERESAGVRRCGYKHGYKPGAEISGARMPWSDYMPTSRVPWGDWPFGPYAPVFAPETPPTLKEWRGS